MINIWNEQAKQAIFSSVDIGKIILEIVRAFNQFIKDYAFLVMQLLSEFLHGTINNWKYTRYRNDISNPIFFILELDGNRNFRLKESARYLYFLFIYLFSFYVNVFFEYYHYHANKKFVSIIYNSDTKCESLKNDTSKILVTLFRFRDTDILFFTLRDVSRFNYISKALIFCVPSLSRRTSYFLLFFFLSKYLRKYKGGSLNSIEKLKKKFNI